MHTLISGARDVPLLSLTIGKGILTGVGAIILVVYMVLMVSIEIPRRRRVLAKGHPILFTVTDAVAVGIFFTLFYLDLAHDQHIGLVYMRAFGVGWLAFVGWRYTVHRRRR